MLQIRHVTSYFTSKWQNQSMGGLNASYGHVVNQNTRYVSFTITHDKGYENLDVNIFDHIADDERMHKTNGCLFPSLVTKDMKSLL